MASCIFIIDMGVVDIARVQDEVFCPTVNIGVCIYSVNKHHFRTTTVHTYYVLSWNKKLGIMYKLDGLPLRYSQVPSSPTPTQTLITQDAS